MSERSYHGATSCSSFSRRELLSKWHSETLTVWVTNAAAIGAILVALGDEAKVPEFENARHKLEDGIHLTLRETYHLHARLQETDRKTNKILNNEIREREREMFYLTTHSTNFIYGYMASDIWFMTILIVRKETRCCHIGYSYQLTARVLLYVPSRRQNSTYHGFCYTSHGALAGTRNSSVGSPHEGSIRWPIAPWANALTTELHLAPGWNDSRWLTGSLTLILSKFPLSSMEDTMVQLFFRNA